MNKEQLCDHFINERLSVIEAIGILEKMPINELNDLTLYLCSYYGGSFANEFLLQFREYLIYGKDFLTLTKEMISSSDHPLLHQTLFEFFFFHAGIQNAQFYYDHKMDVSYLKPYENFISKNLDWIGFGNRYNQMLYKKLGITKEDLIKLKDELFSYSSKK